MANYLGHSTRIFVDGSESGKVTSWSYSQTGLNLIDVTAIGDTTINYEYGLYDNTGSFNCEFIYDDTDTATAYPNMRQGDAPSIQIYLGASSVPVFSGLVTIESFDVSAAINDVVKCSITGRGTLTESIS